MQSVAQTIALLKSSQFFYTIVVDMQGNYSYVSPSYDKHFSFLGGSLNGKQFETTLHPDDRIICQEVGTKAIQEPTQVHQATLRKHDGKGGYIHTQWEFRSLQDTMNQPIGIFCIGYNITAHVESQDLAEIQTEKLNEIGLLQAHEVRRPLANIKGLVDMFDPNATIEELFQLKQMLQDSAETLDDIVRSIIEKSAGK